MDKRGSFFLEKAMERYKNDAALFAEEVIGVTLSDSQQRPALLALSNPDGKKKVAIKSGHGTGKSMLASVAALWFLCTRPNARVILTAPSANQLYNGMMMEIRKWYNKSILKQLDLLKFTKDAIRLNHEDVMNTWFLSAVSVANPENISGTHADNVFAIVDEGAGVDDEIFVRLEGVLTTQGSYMITLGNPSFISGYFYDIFHNENYSKQYDLFTFNAEDSPNVDDDWIEMMKEKYGEDSNVYKVRVSGEFAPLDEEIIIRRDKVKRAIGREILDHRDELRLFIGVDVSSGDSNDWTAISIRHGKQELERYKLKKQLKDIRNHLVMLAAKYSTTHSEIIFNIDTTGIGIQLGQELSDHFYYDNYVEVNEINFSHKAVRQLQYGNVFTEMFFCLAEQIDKVSLISDEDMNTEVEVDLGSRKYGYDTRMRYIAERKREWIKRNKRSPDMGDAVLLAFYDRSGWHDVLEDYLGESEW